MLSVILVSGVIALNIATVVLLFLFLRECRMER